MHYYKRKIVEADFIRTPEKQNEIYNRYHFVVISKGLLSLILLGNSNQTLKIVGG